VASPTAEKNLDVAKTIRVETLAAAANVTPIFVRDIADAKDVVRDQVSLYVPERFIRSDSPAVLEPTGARSADLTITEGRYHQVRRMFAALGNHVVGLHRDRIGGLALPAELEPGDWRILTPDEQAAIFS
jgi:pseudouridine synthase